MALPVFEEADFAVFDVPDFSGRMEGIRERLKAKLAAYGEALAPELSHCAGHAVFPRVAQHMRRRVNPPPETWVAFSRDRRGYKRWTHFRLTVCADGLRAALFVEDDADDKPRFARGLASRARSVCSALDGEPAIQWLSPPVSGSAGGLRSAGRALQESKMLKFHAGVLLRRETAGAMSGDRIRDWSLRQLQRLAPLYALGADDG